MPDVLTQKSYIQYQKLSRYNNFPTYFHTRDKKYVYGLTAQLNAETPYTNHTVIRNDTPDTLALQYYNNPTLYWVICDFNQIIDPYEPLEMGSLIKIPSLSTIEFE